MIIWCALGLSLIGAVSSALLYDINKNIFKAWMLLNLMLAILALYLYT